MSSLVVFARAYSLIHLFEYLVAAFDPEKSDASRIFSPIRLHTPRLRMAAIARGICLIALGVIPGILVYASH